MELIQNFKIPSNCILFFKLKTWQKNIAQGTNNAEISKRLYVKENWSFSFELKILERYAYLYKNFLKIY